MDIQPLISAVTARQGDDAFAVRLSTQEWRLLAGAMQRRELRSGELLVRRGETEAQAYVVEKGELQVFVTGGPPRSHRIAVLREGALIGEPGLFGDTPRMAHVEAVTPCAVWALSAPRLQALADKSPGLVLEVLRAAGAVMAWRMRANLERGIPVI